MAGAVPGRGKQMNNGQKTSLFFSMIDSATKNAIVQNIAVHYGITAKKVINEVTHDEAEHLLDYVTGPQRSATSALMQKYRIS